MTRYGMPTLFRTFYASLLLMTIVACDSPNIAYQVPPLEIRKTYDKVSGSEVIALSQRVAIPNTINTISPFAIISGNNATYGMWVFMRQEERMVFPEKSSVLFYASRLCDSSVYRETIDQVENMSAQTTDEVRETDQHAMRRALISAGALQPNPLSNVLSGPSHVRIHYTEHEFSLPLTTSIVDEIVSSNEAIFRLNTINKTIDIQLSQDAISGIGMIKAEVDKKVNPMFIHPRRTEKPSKQYYNFMQQK